MLITGQIDLMSDVSYTPERAAQMLFPSIPMGAETYYLFVSAANNEITGSNFKTLNGDLTVTKNFNLEPVLSCVSGFAPDTPKEILSLGILNNFFPIPQDLIIRAINTKSSVSELLAMPCFSPSGQ